MTRLIEIMIVMAVLLAIAILAGCKGKAEADGKSWDTAYLAIADFERAKPIYNRELSASEVVHIYIDPFYEPNEPKED